MLFVIVQVRSYVNGALYSILAVPQIREEARAMVSLLVSVLQLCKY